MSLKAIGIWPRRSEHAAENKWWSALVGLLFAVSGVVMLAVTTSAQNPPPSPQAPPDSARKANARPDDMPVPAPEPFDGASSDKMAAHCVTLETEAGQIEIEMMPEVAPESVRNFLNLAATGALDTT